jgi:hypothetical protein
MNTHRLTTAALLVSLTAMVLPATSQAMSQGSIPAGASEGAKKGCKHIAAPGGTMNDGDDMTYRTSGGVTYKLTCRDGTICTTVSGGGREKTTSCKYDPARFGGSTKRPDSKGPSKAGRR